MSQTTVSATLAKAEANREHQNQLRRDLAVRLERLSQQVERLFTRSVEFRYSAIRQRRRAAIAAMLAPQRGNSATERGPG